MNKYLLSVDIEGITGVISKEFSKEGGRYYNAACRYMASDVNAVIKGILKADSKAEILVRDAHGASAVNLDLERLHPKANLIQGWGAIQNPLSGLEPDFKGVFLVGYHAGGQNTEAVLGHTMHSIIHSMKVNGRLVNETGFVALYAGYYDVPIAFISGDNFTISEAEQQLGNVVGVKVKQSFGRGSASSFSLEQSQKLLEEGAAEAISKLHKGQFKPFKTITPVNLEIKFYDSGVRVSVLQNLSEILGFDATYKFDNKEHTVSFDSGNVLTMLQRFNMLMFLVYGISASS